MVSEFQESIGDPSTVAPQHEAYAKMRGCFAAWQSRIMGLPRC